MNLPPANWLFKYRPLDARALEIVRHRALYFAAPPDLNDPFECGLDSMVRGSDDELAGLFEHCLDEQRVRFRREWMYYLRYLDDQAEAREYRQDVEALASASKNCFREYDELLVDVREALERAKACSDSVRYHDALNRFFDGLVTLSRTKLGICCLAGAADSILMWSHYADGHRGVALCFDGDLRIFRKRPGISRHAVTYDASAVIEVVKEGWPGAFVHLYTRKSAQWAYECESRYVSHTGPGLVPFKAPSLRGVILGAQLWEERDRPERRVLVRELLELVEAENRSRPKGQKLHMYRAVKAPGEFRLVIVPMDDVRRVPR